MTQLRTRMIEDMRLAGHAARTQQLYVQAVRALSKHYGNRPPDQLSEEEVRRYLVSVREPGARGTIQTSHYGIKFFYRQTLGVDWLLFKKSLFRESSGRFWEGNMGRRLWIGDFLAFDRREFLSR